MKTSILATCGLVAIAGSAWCVRSAFVGPQAKPISRFSSTQAGAASRKVPAPASTAQSLPIPQRKCEPVVIPPQTASAARVPRQAAAQGASAPSQSASVPVASRTSASAPQGSASVKSPALRPPLFSPTGAQVLTAAPSIAGSPANNSEPLALELDPGVPVPAALLPVQDSLPPAAAAARQQLADSFVRSVNASIAQPGTNAATASDTYFNSLSKSDEQYRSLYGEEAFNRAVIQTALDANGGN